MRELFWTGAVNVIGRKVNILRTQDRIDNS